MQDVKTAAYDSMPISAIATGLVDHILPPDKMPEKLVEYAKRYYDTGKTGVIVSESEDAVARIVTLIQRQMGYDFSLYKQNMISNRIERRMNVHQIDSISDYIRFLQENQHEVEMLFKELLIGVTSFFRDPEAFEVLKKEVIPDILKNRTINEPLRIWAPACSSGEEAYSIAMIFKEYMEETNDNFNIQIFATDIDKESIEIARAGVYPAGIAADVSQERLQRFFCCRP